VPGILEPPTSLVWGLRSSHSCISRHFAPRAFTLDALWSASFSSHSLVLHVSLSCSICAFCCSLHHGIIITFLPCCLTCMLSHKNCSLRSPLCPLLHMYHRLFVLCRFLLEYWSSLVGNKTCSQHNYQRWAWTGSGLDILQDTCDFLDQDWIWIFIFEKNWIRTGSGYLFDFHNEIFLRALLPF